MGFWMSRARDGRGWSVMTGFKLLITATLETPPPIPRAVDLAARLQRHQTSRCRIRTGIDWN